MSTRPFPKSRASQLADALQSHQLVVEPTAPTVAFTSINWKYLPKALVLAQSLKRFNPDWEFHILLNDHLPSGTSFDHVDVIAPINSIGIEGFESWCFSHEVVELCTATKSFYFRFLFEAGYENVFYFDPDMEIFNKLDYLLDELSHADTLLTPHADTEAVRESEILYTEMSVLAHGVFNLGFLGTRNTPNGRRVIDFWCKRMERYCHDDHARGLFTDQKWFNLVPVYFDGVTVLKHKGCNVASWNVAHRPIKRSGNTFHAGPDELLFFHFSGYDASVPRRMFEIFGAYNDDIGSLIEAYDAKVLHQLKCNQEANLPWIYAAFDNGQQISRGIRRFYRSHLEHRICYPHPYTSKDPDSFYHVVQQNTKEALDRQYDPPGLLRKHF